MYLGYLGYLDRLDYDDSTALRSPSLSVASSSASKIHLLNLNHIKEGSTQRWQVGEGEQAIGL